MHPVLKSVHEELGLPVDSAVRFAQAATEKFDVKEPHKFTVARFQDLSKSLFGVDLPQMKSSNPRKQASTTFKYVVQNIMTMAVVDLAKAMENASHQTTALFKKANYLLLEGTGASEVVTPEGQVVQFSRRKSGYVKGTGKTGRVKGEKQVRAKEIFAEMAKANPNVEAKEIVERFMKDLKMTKAGATTYAYNCRKAAGLVSGKKGKKAKAK